MSKAVDALSQKRLVFVENAAGSLLVTTLIRQKASALYYRPNLSLLGYDPGESVENVASCVGNSVPSDKGGKNVATLAVYSPSASYMVKKLPHRVL